MQNALVFAPVFFLAEMEMAPLWDGN